MQSVIIYYSLTGNTKKAAEILAEYLKLKGQVDVLELVPTDESNNFFKQCARASKRIRAMLSNTNLDLARYDLVCFGSPVWAFAPAPAMNTCLDTCCSVENKDIILFSTVGGLGDTRCLDYMQEILTKKGAKNFKRFSIRQAKVKDKEFVLSKIKEAGI